MSDTEDYQMEEQEVRLICSIFKKPIPKTKTCVPEYK